jgi:hypothetical protein
MDCPKMFLKSTANCYIIISIRCGITGQAMFSEDLNTSVLIEISQMEFLEISS